MKPGFFSFDSQPRHALVACGIRLYERGLTVATDGNISLRIAPSQILTTPTGVSKGYMTEDRMVLVDLEGNILEGHERPSSELPLHLRLYKENPDIQAVVHAHPPAATAFAAAGIPLDAPVLQEAIVQLGTVPVAPYALPGSLAVGDSVAPLCREYRGALLEFHGAVTWGKTLEQALHRMECLEHYANILLHLKTLGVTPTIPEEQLQQLRQLQKAFD